METCPPGQRPCYRRLILAIIIITALALILRLPFITAGLPYFYDEDEGHHFNRSVNMVKSGDFNPHYFHKPSLHFYLRLPVIAAAFISSVKHGELKSVREIKTDDSYGLSGFAFSAWPVRIAKWNRAFSVSLSLAMVVLSMLIASRLTNSLLASTVAGLISAVSPEIIKYSPVVGVDILMATLFVLATYLALLIYDKPTFARLAGLGIVCGLTISSKYNAAPIAVLPLTVIVLNRPIRFDYFLVALLSPLVGFLMGSPYILASFPLFLDHLAYEAWHYAIAGHDGHTGTPGLGQALFYYQWLMNDAMGYVSALIGAVGMCALLFKRREPAILVFCAPLLFALFMILQKANFTRNMLVIVPFFGIGAGYAAWWLSCRFIKDTRLQKIAACVCILLLIAQPLIGAIELRASLNEQNESRMDFEQWLTQIYKPFSDTAVAGQAQLALPILKMGGVQRFNQAIIDPLDLYLSGIDRILYSGPHSILEDKETLLLNKFFPGSIEQQRVVQNPELRVYTFRGDLRANERLNSYLKSKGMPEIVISVAIKPTDHSSCDYSSGLAHPQEDYCWLQSRVEKIKFKNATELATVANKGGTVGLQFELLSPWPGQIIGFESDKYSQTFQLPDSEVGKWQTIKLELPMATLQSVEGLILTSAQVHSPQDWKINEDSRRLGVAIRSAVAVSRP